ncbi:hypothetical protein SATRM34S_05498 [Streptomyces atroolivaceus]
MARAECEGADGGEAFQGPVEQQRVQVGGPAADGGGLLLRPVRHLAPLLVEFRDALSEQVEECGHGDRSRRELEEREHLGHGLDGLGHRGGLDAVG